MRSLDLPASLTAQRTQRNGIVIRKPGKRNVQTDLTNGVLYLSTLGILETRERQAETPGEQLMRIGTERSPEGQDTIRILETTETPNDMIVEWEWRYEGDNIMDDHF